MNRTDPDDIADRVVLRDETLLSDNHYILKKATFDYRRSDGDWQTLTREVYDRGNGAAILLYDRSRGTILLIKQFRYPAYANGYRKLLIEVCAGLLDESDPIACVRKEAEEETGYRVRDPRRVMDVFMSPGAVTERVVLFTGEYSRTDRVAAGGGLATEGEDITQIELTLDEALAMVESGEIVDAKTVLLLQYAKLNRLME